MSGCSASEEFDPDVEPAERLGAAPRVSMEITAEEEYRETTERPFEEWATRRAAEHAAGRLREILGDNSLIAQGVEVGVGEVDLEELDPPTETDPPAESEFKRAVEIGLRVSHLHQYSSDGDLVSEPDVEFSAVVDASPRSFEVTMKYPEEIYVAILPTMCRRGWIQDT